MQLNKNFFNRSALKVAKELLGKFLIRKIGKKTIAVMITETEAYDGPHDKASHASRGRTPRNEPMFGEAVHFYVYFTYGMHWMLNIVTGEKDYPAAVLIRSGIATSDPEPLRYGAGKRHGKQNNINGPARLAKFLKIDGRFNKKPASKKTGLWFENRGISASWRIKPSQIKRGPRVGVAYAGKWAKKPYNFKLKTDNRNTLTPF